MERHVAAATWQTWRTATVVIIHTHTSHDDMRRKWFFFTVFVTFDRT